MGWRFLIDGDTDITAADALISRGHDAVTVGATIGKGTPDARVVQFAREADRVLITTDRDFLDPELNTGLRVLLVSGDDASGKEIAERAAGLARLAEAPTELHRVTWI